MNKINLFFFELIITNNGKKSKSNKKKLTNTNNGKKTTSIPIKKKTSRIRLVKIGSGLRFGFDPSGGQKGWGQWVLVEWCKVSTMLTILWWFGLAWVCGGYGAGV